MSSSAPDWNEIWKTEQRTRRHPDDAAYWNARAHSFSQTVKSSSYAEKFLELAALNKDDTVFDMGCGSGTLAIPLAQAGHHVVAADFSQTMLDLMMERAAQEGVDSLIRPMLLAWDDDWSTLDAPCCDVAFASRSIATADLQASLQKLVSMAKRKACITLSSGQSPRTDTVLYQAIGRATTPYPDCLCGFNILWGLGYRPRVDYILSERTDEFTSFEHAIEKTCEIMNCTPEERGRLIAYSEEHLHKIADTDGVAHWEYDHKRITSWAFMSWDV